MMTYTTKGYEEKHIFVQANDSTQTCLYIRAFLKDRLTFQLFVNDVFGNKRQSHMSANYGKLKETIFDETVNK